MNGYVGKIKKMKCAEQKGEEKMAYVTGKCSAYHQYQNLNFVKNVHI